MSELQRLENYIHDSEIILYALIFNTTRIYIPENAMVEKCCFIIFLSLMFSLTVLKKKKPYLIVYQRKQKLETQNFSIQQLTSSTIYLLIDENKTSHEIRQLIINFE